MGGSFLLIKIPLTSRGSSIKMLALTSLKEASGEMFISFVCRKLLSVR